MVKAFDESLLLLEEARLDTKRIARQKKDIEALKTAVGEMKVSCEGTEEELCQILPLSYGPNPSVECASSAVEIKYDKQKGRYIVATNPLIAGDTLFVEEAYASVLLPAHYATHCHHCYAKTQAVIPCHQCSQVRYCSQVCVDESWEKYHKWECGNLDLMHSVGIAHLSCRVLIVTGLEYIKEIREELLKTTSSTSYPFDSPDGQYRSDYLSVYHLVSHVEDMHGEDTFQYSLTALLLLMLLDRLNYFSSLEIQTLRERLISCNLNSRAGSAPSTPTHKCPDEDLAAGPPTMEVFVGGLLLRHILQLVCNANAITELQVSPGASVLSQRQAKVATGIFPTTSLMNHSCNPTVISSFYKNILIVRAISDVESQSEVFNCYGPHYRRMARDDRQRSLLEQYYFTCECDACSNEEDREQRFQALKCAHCSGPLRTPDSTNRATCLDCEKTQDCTVLLQKVFAAHDFFVQGLQLAAKGSFKDALERLKKCHRLREKVMYKYNRQLSEVQDQLACCYASLDRMMVAIEYLRPTLVITENIYGSNSIEYANELQKYSDLLLNAIAQLSRGHHSYDQAKHLIEETKCVLEQSLRIFSIHYGPHHEALKELKVKQGTLEAIQQ